MILKCYIIARVDSDYERVHSEQAFVSGSSDGATSCVDIAIINDLALEGDQTFILSMTTSDPQVMIGAGDTNVTITDNDSEYHLRECHNIVKMSSKYLYIDVTVSIPASMRVSEGEGMVQVCATLSAIESIQTNFLVSLSSTDNTGTDCRYPKSKIEWFSN